MPGPGRTSAQSASCRRSALLTTSSTERFRSSARARSSAVSGRAIHYKHQSALIRPNGSARCPVGCGSRFLPHSPGRTAPAVEVSLPCACRAGQRGQWPGHTAAGVEQTRLARHWPPDDARTPVGRGPGPPDNRLPADERLRQRIRQIQRPCGPGCWHSHPHWESSQLKAGQAARGRSARRIGPTFALRATHGDAPRPGPGSPRPERLPPAPGRAAVQKRAQVNSRPSQPRAVAGRARALPERNHPPWQ